MHDVLIIGQNKALEALWEVAISLKNLEFALRLEGYCQTKPNSYAKFLNDISVPHICDLDDGKIVFSDVYTDDVVQMHASITILNSFSITAQIINKAYEYANIDVILPPTNNDECLRLYIHNIRNIFQHSSGAPIWDIRPKKALNFKLKVNSVSKNIYFEMLNGGAFSFSQIGGLKFWLDAVSLAAQNIRIAINT